MARLGVLIAHRTDDFRIARTPPDNTNDTGANSHDGRSPSEVADGLLAANSAQRGEYTEVQDRLLL